MLLEKDITSIESLPGVAKELISTFKDHRIFLFEAEMGSGKTTFIKELCKQLGSTDNFSSPTYSIVNEYRANNTHIFHFDLYRLKDSHELMDIGFNDYIQPDSYVFIEWPELAKQLLEGEKTVTVNIHNDGIKRTLITKSNS